MVARLVNRALGRRNVPPSPPDGPPRSSGLRIFATGPDWVQLDWRALGPGPVRVTGPFPTATVEADGGPGALVIEGVPVGAEVEVVVDGPGAGSRRELRARTLTPPPGEELYRFATVNDVHIGQEAFGFFDTLIEIPEPDEQHPTRALRAAVAGATEWGATELLVKGDLVHTSDRAAWVRAADLLSAFGGDVHVVAGNHEHKESGEVHPAEGARDVGLTLADDLAVLDRPGLRLLLADTTRPGHNSGTVQRFAGAALDAAAGTSLPVLCAMHHQPMRFRYPLYLPVGIPGPEVRPFLDALGAANRRSVVATGHTHRHRHRAHGPVTVTEVGSTKDYPGTWCGYQVFEGGIVETTRRIGEPSVIRWTEWTRRAALGVWPRWSPGDVTDRSWSRTW